MCYTNEKFYEKCAIVDDHRIVSRYHFVRVLEMLVRCRYAVQFLDVIFNNSYHVVIIFANTIAFFENSLAIDVRRCEIGRSGGGQDFSYSNKIARIKL